MTFRVAASLPLLIALAFSSPARAEDPAPAAVAPSTAFVILDTARPNAILERRPSSLDRRGDLSGSEGFDFACVAPCKINVDRTGRFRVAGTGIAPTYSFQLPGGPGPFTIHAETASAGRETAGLALILAGAGALVLGGLGVTATSSASTSDSSAGRAIMTAGITTLALGGVLIAVGASLRFSAGRVKISIEPAGTSAGSSPGREPRVALTPSGLVF